MADNEPSYRWLKFGDIKEETESTIRAAQNKAIRKNYFKNKLGRKKLTANDGYVNNMKKLLPT